MRKYKYILLLLLIPFIGVSQESLKIGQRYEPVYSQYWVNGLAINPAYAGSRECFSNIILYRNQWMGFEGAPVTQTLSSHTPFKDQKNAAGLFLFHEEIGVSNYFDIYGNYAFRFQFGGGKLSLGLRAGVTYFQGNYSDINADPEETVNDLLLEDESEMFPNAGFGAYYYTDLFYLGLSVPKLLSHELEGSQKKMSVSPNNYDFLFTGGVLVNIADKVKWKPSILVRYRLDNSFQIDGSMNFILYDAIWTGFSYRHNDEWVFMVEYQATDQIRAGVAYDFASGDLAGQHSGSLEVILRYDFKYKIRATSPRYF